jgi:site-specific DNA-adenine methylase
MITLNLEGRVFSGFLGMAAVHDESEIEHATNNDINGLLIDGYNQVRSKKEINKRLYQVA